MAEIKCPLRESAMISGKEPAIIQGDLEIRYAELDTMVTNTAERLKEAGCEPGDRVALFMVNGWELPVLVLALIRMGAIACPLSTRLPAEGLRRELKEINASRPICVSCDRKTVSGATRVAPSAIALAR